MRKILSLFLICLSGLFLSTAVFAQSSVQAEGSAPIRNDDVSLARQMALQEAMRNAALQGAAHVQAETRVSNSALLADNVSVRADAKLSEVQVLDEWADEEDSYHVLIRAQVQQAGAKPVVSVYRRKVAVTQFRVADRGSLADLPQIEIALAQELRRRLDSSGGIMALDATQYVLPETDAVLTAQGPLLENLLVTTAENLGVQLLVSGVIHDTGTTHKPIRTATRHFDLELVVIDGISGQTISRHRVSRAVEHWLEWQSPVVTVRPSSDAFFATPLGREIDTALNELVAELNTDINHLPFAARVVKVKNDMVYLDAGAMANVQVGDRLTAYQFADEPMARNLTAAYFGVPEVPAGYLTVTQVQPAFAVAQMESEKTMLQPGDIIRFGW